MSRWSARSSANLVQPVSELPEKLVLFAYEKRTYTESSVTMKIAPDWLTKVELAELTRIPAALLQRGAAAGLSDGLSEIVNGERRYTPGATGLGAWSDRLGCNVVAGYAMLDEAHRHFQQHARRLRRRLALTS